MYRPHYHYVSREQLEKDLKLSEVGEDFTRTQSYFLYKASGKKWIPTGYSSLEKKYPTQRMLAALAGAKKLLFSPSYLYMHADAFGVVPPRFRSFSDSEDDECTGCSVIDNPLRTL